MLDRRGRVAAIRLREFSLPLADAPQNAAKAVGLVEAEGAGGKSTKERANNQREDLCLRHPHAAALDAGVSDEQWRWVSGCA